MKDSLYRAKDNIQNQDYLTSFKELKEAARIFRDRFVRELTEKIEINELSTRDEIVHAYAKVKNEIYFNMFYDYENQRITNFMYSYFVSSVLPFLANLFNPQYHSISGMESDVTKKVKAINFVEYYLKKGDYYKAYSNLKYLKDIRDVAGFTKELENIVKSELLTDIIDTHINL